VRPGLLRSEWTKVVSVRATYGLALGCLAYVALTIVALVLAAGQPGVPSLSDQSTVRTVYAAAGTASALVLCIGILGMTTEYRHQTVTPTFLVTPRRSRVLIAKLAVHAAVGLLVAVACVVVTVALASATLALRTHAAVGVGTIVQVQLGALLGYAIYAAVGVCVGALIRNQVAAIVGALLWTALAESLTVSLLPAVGRWLPGGALQGVLQATPTRGGSFLPVWSATALLLAYAAAFALLAARTTLRRDVT
jgi:ABC-2 type transport system permease protein